MPDTITPCAHQGAVAGARALLGGRLHLLQYEASIAVWSAARLLHQARLAQSAERKALNLVVVGSSPTVGVSWSLPPAPCSLPPAPCSLIPAPAPCFLTEEFAQASKTPVGGAGNHTNNQKDTHR